MRRWPVEKPGVEHLGEFSDVELARVPGSRNWIVLGWNGVPPSMEMRRRALSGTPLEAPLAWMVDGSHFAPWEPEASRDGMVLVDGHSPVEALAHRAWSSW